MITVVSKAPLAQPAPEPSSQQPNVRCTHCLHEFFDERPDSHRCPECLGLDAVWINPPSSQQGEPTPEGSGEFVLKKTEANIAGGAFSIPIEIKDSTCWIRVWGDDKQLTEATAKRICEAVNLQKDLEASYENLNDGILDRSIQISNLSAELAKARETNQRLNKRCQIAESALPEWQTIKDIDKEGQARSVAHGLRRYYFTKLEAELKAAQDEVGRLREFGKYAVHASNCPKVYAGPCCTCGLDQLKGRIE